MDVITQRKFTNKNIFKFGEDDFEYTSKDRGGVLTRRLRYTEIYMNDRSYITERNEYFRNLGWIWVAIGLVLFVVNQTGLIWFIIGLVCLIIYYISTTSYISILADSGKIFIINDKKADQIIDKIWSEKKRIVLEDLEPINFSAPVEIEKGKYKHLLDEEYIDKKKYDATILYIDLNIDKFPGYEI